VLFLHDLGRVGQADHDAADAAISAKLPAEVSVLQVYNKADLNPAAVLPDGALGVSARTSQGLDTLRHALLERAGWQASQEGLFIARTRHVQALRRALAHVALAQQHALQGDTALDLLAEELRLAHRALQAITGEFSNEDLLGEIFSRFCIGK
jgi:tRNA modification GTPase